MADPRFSPQAGIGCPRRARPSLTWAQSPPLDAPPPPRPKASCRTPDGLPAFSLTDLIAELGTVCRNQLRIGPADHTFPRLTNRNQHHRFPLPGADNVKAVSLVSRKNQITIPADVLREAGLEPGDDVRVRTAGPGRIELIKTDELIDEFAGRLDSATYPPGYLDDLRAEWQ